MLKMLYNICIVPKNKGENNMSIKDEMYTNITQTLGKLDGIQ